MTGSEDRASLTFAEAAKRIGCSERQLRRMIDAGAAPVFFMVGVQRRFRESAIEQWVLAQEREVGRVLKRRREGVIRLHPMGQPKL